MPQHDASNRFMLREVLRMACTDPQILSTRVQGVNLQPGSLADQLGVEPTLPGVFPLQHDNILWQHTFQHAGDQPDFKRVPALAEFTR
jgi:hypothetical protein